MDDRLEDMMRDIGEDSFKRAHVYDTLCSDKDKPLYPGCTNFTRLSAVLKLINLKANNGWSDKSFTELLELLIQMLPEGNVMPNRYYEAKKVLCPMGLEYEKIHACPNDCILYRKEFVEYDHCPKCKASRYKKKDGDSSDGELTKKGPPAKVVWYLPIISRFKRLFANANDAKNLRWHADERKCDGQIRHVADSLQWKKIDSLFPNFGKEPRNLRLGLATDGMNPFGNQSTNHSSWPVLLMIYNLSPWLCMKRKYMMLSMMISGPHQPGNDIDVYLSPLIDDLRLLWEKGVDVLDAYSGEQFNMRAMLFCTINDFPAYGNLSGYIVKGHHACPICEKDTSFRQLKEGKKTVYLRHRKFLPRFHPYRRLRKAFDGDQENGVAPKPLTGEEVYQRQRAINVDFGKCQKKSAVKNIWKKRSVFFDLPYWSSLDVRHCIDVMHVEKNVCDSVIGTLLNIKGKTKDGANARLDMDLMGIRQELLPQKIGNKTYLPPACHTLSKNEKTSFCKCLQSIKVPHGYSSNVKRLVSLKDLKLIGLKSHDCHVLMQQLLPVAIRGILPDNVRKTITRLCLFFNAICCKAIDSFKLDELEKEAAVILCQLEMYFPPAFFDIMVHLIVHLVREIRLCGPIFLRWMYPVERYMKILKGYTKNPHRPEASIVERYIAEEAIEFCSNYLSEVDAIGVPKSRHDGRCDGAGTQGLNVKSMNIEVVLQAHLYIY
jgi:ssDNA-binding Zn-finger/Zn-ribbon topoisomerase 1